MRALILAALLIVTACAGMTLAQQVEITCRSYAATLNSLAAFREDISDKDADRITELDNIAGPMCENPGTVDKTGLDAVEDILWELQGIESEAKNG